MIDTIRNALIERNRSESWRYISQETGIDAGQLCAFAAGNRSIGIKNLEILARYLGLSLIVEK